MLQGILKQPARSAMTKMDAIRKQTFILNLNPSLYIASSALTEVSFYTNLYLQ